MTLDAMRPRCWICREEFRNDDARVKWEARFEARVVDVLAHPRCADGVKAQVKRLNWQGPRDTAGELA